MKRIMVLLTVVALMVVMTAMTVAPAFAAPAQFVCVIGTTVQPGVPANEVHYFRDAGFTCVKQEARR